MAVSINHPLVGCLEACPIDNSNIGTVCPIMLRCCPEIMRQNPTLNLLSRKCETLSHNVETLSRNYEKPLTETDRSKMLTGSKHIAHRRSKLYRSTSSPRKHHRQQTESSRHADSTLRQLGIDVTQKAPRMRSSWMLTIPFHVPHDLQNTLVVFDII